MYKNKNKTMNIIIIVISILAVLMLIVAIGFLVFNKVKDSGTEELNSTIETTTASTISTTITTTPTTTTGTTTPTTTTTTPPNVKTGNENFEITQWGITGYYNGSYGVQYSIISGTITEFTSSDLTGTCEGGIFANIQRLDGDDVYPSFPGTQTVEEVFTSGTDEQKSNMKLIGSKYYVYVSPQAPCYQSGSTTPDLIFIDLSNAMRDYFSTLVAV